MPALDFSFWLSVLFLAALGIVLYELLLTAWRGKGARSAGVWVRNARTWLPILAVVLVIRSFLMEPFQIPSESMLPTLQRGDFLLANKYRYGLHLPVLGTEIWRGAPPERGDVVIFRPPEEKRYFVKRVVGLPGEKLEYRNRILYVDGREMPQKFLAALPPHAPLYRLLQEHFDDSAHSIRNWLGRSRGFSVEVRPGHYFLMGDNRDNSLDSRSWGQVPEQRVVGKALWIWMHWKGLLSLPRFHRVGRIQ